MNYIHFVPNGKNYSSFEKMINSEKPTEITNEAGMKKELNKGNHVYCYINPYDSTMSTGEEKRRINICWSLDREKAIDNYYNSSESC